eukprot:scaffold6466_cov38-Attheya_sp.AAC.5
MWSRLVGDLCGPELPCAWSGAMFGWRMELAEADAGCLVLPSSPLPCPCCAAAYYQHFVPSHRVRYFLHHLFPNNESYVDSGDRDKCVTPVAASAIRDTVDQYSHPGCGRSPHSPFRVGSESAESGKKARLLQFWVG